MAEQFTQEWMRELNDGLVKDHGENRKVVSCELGHQWTEDKRLNDAEAILCHECTMVIKDAIGDSDAGWAAYISILRTHGRARLVRELEVGAISQEFYEEQMHSLSPDVIHA